MTKIVPSAILGHFISVMGKLDTKKNVRLTVWHFSIIISELILPADLELADLAFVVAVLVQELQA